MTCFAFPKPITFISKDHRFQANSTHKLGLEFNRIQPKLTSQSPGGIKMVGRANDAAAVRLASGASGRNRANDAAAVLLASGANGRINALLSLYTLRSIWGLISAFFLILTLPFHGRRRCMVVGSVPDLAEKGCGKEEKYQAMAGMVVRVPRKSAAAVDKEVAARRTMAIRRVVEGNEEEGGRDTVRDFSLFTTSRGDTIFTQSWTPVQDPIRSVIVLLHGLNEHSGRYNDFAKKLNANGFKVYGVDWIGHGGSDGLHAYIHSLDYAVSDMKGFLTKVQAENPDLPCFCFGHSTGGAIVLKAALDPKVQQQIAGIVLTSPAIGVQPSHPIFVILAPIFSLLLPRFQLSAANKRGIAVSRDPQALKAKYSDPLVFTGSIRIRTGYEILRVTSYLQRNVNRVTVPFFVLHGTGDSVTDPRATRKLYDEAASTDKTMKLYEGLLHDLLFEPEKEEVAESIVMWLDSRVSK